MKITDGNIKPLRNVVMSKKEINACDHITNKTQRTFNKEFQYIDRGLETEMN